ncbi:MAG: hypothetical protein PHG82_04035 [Candidatus Gracilibacteria bacterium]|nr:hypothetical protein [Candidatus Gracilibacteria bacterium]
MEIKKIKGYIVGLVIGTTLGLTAFTNGGSFNGITSMTQTWFNTIQTKLDGTYAAGNMCTSDGSGQIQCITAIPTGLGLPQNSQTFTVDGIFTVPAGVTQLMVIGAHAGAGGSSGGRLNTGYACGGGGGSASVFSAPIIISVTPGQQFPVVIGIGGAGGAASTLSSAQGNPGLPGGTTSFGSYNWYGSTAILSVNGYGGGAGAGTAGGVSGIQGATNGSGSAAIGGIYQFYTQAQGGGTQVINSPGGAGGTSNCNNGTAGGPGLGGPLTTGYGGKGGDGKVIVYR